MTPRPSWLPSTSTWTRTTSSCPWTTYWASRRFMVSLDAIRLKNPNLLIFRHFFLFFSKCILPQKKNQFRFPGCSKWSSLSTSSVQKNNKKHNFEFLLKKKVKDFNWLTNVVTNQGEVSPFSHHLTLCFKIWTSQLRSYLTGERQHCC